MAITYGSVCSDFEAATRSWHPPGWCRLVRQNRAVPVRGVGLTGTRSFGLVCYGALLSNEAGFHK